MDLLCVGLIKLPSGDVQQTSAFSESRLFHDKDQNRFFYHKTMRLNDRIRAAKRRVEPEIQWAFTPRMEPGNYPAYCRSAQIYRDAQFKRWVCAVQFDVLDGNRIDVLGRLTWYLNLGGGEKPHVTRRGKYWAAWVLANGGPPRRKDRLAPIIFRKRYAQVTVEDTAKDFAQRSVTSDKAYSVIRDVIVWETGSGEE